MSKGPNKGGRVNHPTHYNKGIETIDYIESWDMNFNEGNVVKYITRAKYKDNQIEDLEKTIWYAQRELERVKGQQNGNRKSRTKPNSSSK